MLLKGSLDKDRIPLPSRIPLTQSLKMKNSGTGVFCFLICLTSSFLILQGCKKESLYQKTTKPEVKIAANDPRFNANIIDLVSDTVYIITTNLIIDSGKVLKIDPGTLVKVNDNISVTISEGA